VLITPTGELQERAAIVTGRATADATRAVATKHADWSAAYHILGRTGLTCSSAGFGSYRVDRRVQQHRTALAKALQMGINIIDTSSNYATGNSERLIGEVLGGLITQGAIRREEVIIVSKGGYIQGALYEEMQRRANTPHADYSAGSELSEIVRYNQGLWHSIHPDFLRDQIDESLERLQLETIDVYLLHNPEYFVQWAIGEGRAEDEVRDEYNRRIKQAFTYLESEVKRGRIQYYGISSNTFPKPEESIDRTSLELSWNAAEEVAKELSLTEHHFAVVQFPLNIFEPGAVTERNQHRSMQTVLEYAAEKGIGVLINRPLNAIVGNPEGKGSRLIRLADYPNREIPPDEDIEDLVHDVKLQEEELVRQSLPFLGEDPQSKEAVEKFLTLGQNLDGDNWKEFASVEEWQEISRNILAPRIQYAFNILRPIAAQNPLVMASLQNYAEAVDGVLEHISNYYSNRGHDRSQKIHRALNALMGPDYEGLSLSQKAVLLIRSLPQVSSVLVGMRSEEYVEDVVYGLQAKALPNAAELWQRLATAGAE